MSKKNSRRQSKPQPQPRSNRGAIIIGSLVGVAIIASVIFTREENVLQGSAPTVPAITVPDASTAQSDGAMTSTEEKYFLSLVRNHRSPKVREMATLFVSGELRFSVRQADGTEVPLKDMRYDPKTNTVRSSSFFLMDPQVPNCVRTIAIRHELKHAEDDLAGMHLPRFFMPSDSEAEASLNLQRMLHTEWRAGLAEEELKGLSCPFINTWGLTLEARCQKFKAAILTDKKHVPMEVFARYPALKQYVENTSCDEYAGPF